MLVLVIPQTYTSVLFVFNLKFFILFLDYLLINWVFESLKKSNTFWLIITLIEAETGQGTVS